MDNKYILIGILGIIIVAMFLFRCEFLCDDCCEEGYEINRVDKVNI